MTAGRISISSAPKSKSGDEIFRERCRRRRIRDRSSIILFSAVCFYALPFDAVAASPHVASDVVESFAGHGAAFWITLAMIVSALGTLNSSILSGARVHYAMARDGIFFRIRRHHSSEVSHARQRADFSDAFWRALMALHRHVRRPDFALYFCRMDFLRALAVVAMFRLRHMAPDMPRPIARGDIRWFRACSSRAHSRSRSVFGSSVPFVRRLAGDDSLRIDFLSATGRKTECQRAVAFQRRITILN